MSYIIDTSITNIFSDRCGFLNKIQDSAGNTIWEKPTSPQPINTDLCITILDGGNNNYLCISPDEHWLFNYRFTTTSGWSSTDDDTVDMGSNNCIYLSSSYYPKGVNLNCKKQLGSQKDTSNDPNVPFIVTGNLHSLGGINDDRRLNENNAYAGLFAYTGIVDASYLNMSFDRLSHNCYQNMFYECASLINAPVLPANTLAQYCYDSMFVGCTSLTTAPALPVTILTDYCYSSMFAGCTSLITVPNLQATRLAANCCEGMFQDCTSLTTAPILYALELAPYCYQYMFSGCTNLNSVTTYAQNISAYQCLNYWLFNVAPTGTFYNNGGASYTYPSASGIPSGWTEV